MLRTTTGESEQLSAAPFKFSVEASTAILREAASFRGHEQLESGIDRHWFQGDLQLCYCPVMTCAFGGDGEKTVFFGDAWLELQSFVFALTGVNITCATGSLGL